MANLSDYAQSIVNRVRYNAKNDATQIDLMRAMVKQQLEGVTLADGVEINEGVIITRMREIIGVFTDDQKEQKNAALTLVRSQMQKAFAELDGTDNLTIGLKAASAKKKDRIEIRAKAEKKEKTLADHIQALIDAYGTAAVTNEVTKQVQEIVGKAA